MNLINPHELVGDRQWVFWNELKMRVPLEFELIDYFKAPVVRKGSGAYVIYYAKAITPLKNLGVEKGDMIILFISFRAFVFALNKLKAEFKVPCTKKLADGKNLFIRLERYSPYEIKVHYQEIRVPDEEQLNDAAKQYALIKAEHGDKEERK